MAPELVASCKLQVSREARRVNDWLKVTDNRQLLLDAIRLEVRANRNFYEGREVIASFDDAEMAIALTLFAAWWAGIDALPEAPEITTAYELEGKR